MSKYLVTYNGILDGRIIREFDSLERAIQWAQWAGVHTYASIYEVRVSQGVNNKGAHDTFYTTKADQ